MTSNLVGGGPGCLGTCSVFPIFVSVSMFCAGNVRSLDQWIG